MSVSGDSILRLLCGAFGSIQAYIDTGVPVSPANVSIIVRNVGRGHLKTFVQGLELQRQTLQLTVLLNVQCLSYYAGRRNPRKNDTGPKIVIDLAEALLTIKFIQREGAVTRIISILQSAAFNGEVFRSYK